MRLITNPRWSMRPPAQSEVDWSSSAWRRHPQARGLYAWWPTLAGAGNKLREMVRSWDATAQNGAALGPDPVTGIAANNLNGNTHNRHWLSSLPWSGGPVTVSFWLRTLSSSGEPSAFGYDSGNLNRFCCSWPYNDEVCYWDYGDMSGSLPGRLTINFDPGWYGKWQHITLISGGSAIPYMAIAVDGEIVAAKNDSSNHSASANLRFGGWQRSSPSQLFSHTGMLADFRIYNRVLTPSEIWQLYAPQTRWSLLPVHGSKRYFTLVGGPEPTPETHPYYFRNFILRRSA